MPGIEGGRSEGGGNRGPGRLETATARRTATTSMVSAACARLIGASASCPSGWSVPRWSTQTSRRSWTRSFSARPSPSATGRGTKMTITIVGVDEADLDCGQVSWLSPVARALMNPHQGDIVELRAPAGSSKSRCSPFAVASPIQDRLSDQSGQLRHPERLLTGADDPPSLTHSVAAKRPRPLPRRHCGCIPAARG